MEQSDVHQSKQLQMVLAITKTVSGGLPKGFFRLHFLRYVACDDGYSNKYQRK